MATPYKRIKTASGAPETASLAAHFQPASQATARTSPSSASVVRPSGQGLRLTVKTAPTKLRQATSGSAPSGRIPSNPYGDGSESDATPQPTNTRAARSTRNPRTVVDKDTSEEEDDEDDEDDEEEDEDELEDDDNELIEDQDMDEVGDDASEDDELEDVDQELLANEDSQEDAEGSEEELQDHPPPLVIKQMHVRGQSKPNVTVTAPPEGPLMSVEEKELEDEDDELSELDSGDERRVDAGDDEEEDEDDSDSDDEELDGSRSATPDPSKLTKRQRGYLEEETNLLALSNEAQKKKHLSAEEHAMRRAEMARRRKNLSEKRNEEEKMDTINKLLKKPAPKRRTRAEIIAQQQADALAGTPGIEEGEEERPDPLYVRWVNNRKGSRIGVPEEWLEAPVGEALGNSTGRMVQEVA